MLSPHTLLVGPALCRSLSPPLKAESLLLEGWETGSALWWGRGKPNLRLCLELHPSLPQILGRLSWENGRFLATLGYLVRMSYITGMV